jgi:hypothetical protein
MRLTATLTLFALATFPSIEATVKSETVGLSEERLHRVHETIQQHIDAHDISGAVTLVARKGRVAHLEAHGLMDIEPKKPMAKTLSSGSGRFRSLSPELRF